MRVLDLFSGIGGFSLGLERAGMETVAFCEFDKHAQKVLKKHWPDVPIFDDVRTLDGRQFRGTVDLVCGGFPCQDLSVAGKKAGFEGERSSLYREMLRIIGECLPRYAIFENVTGLLTGESGRWFAQFLYDLAEIGYDAEWHCISASELGAHHHRDRVWIIAYPKHDGQATTEIRRKLREREDNKQAWKKPASKPKGLCGKEFLPNAKSKREGGKKTTSKQGEQPRKMHSKPSCSSQEMGDTKCGTMEALISQKLYAILQESNRKRAANRFSDRGSIIGWEWATEPSMGRVADGVSGRSHRLKQLGNAVVPQIPEAIGRAIMAVENTSKN